MVGNRYRINQLTADAIPLQTFADALVVTTAAPLKCNISFVTVVLLL